MSRKHIHFVRKITAALLFGAFLSIGCASIAMTQEKDQPTLPDIDKQVAALKDSFTGLYRNLWNKHNLSVQLRDCVTRAVDDYSGFFTAFADKEDYIKAQKEINNLMSGSFNNLLRELEKEFDVIFSEHVVTYYRDLFGNLLENADDPALRAKFGETGLLKGSNPVLRDEAERASRENRVKRDEVKDMVTTGNDVIKKITGIDPVSDVTKMGVSAFENLPGADTVTDFAKAGISAFKKLTGVDLGLGAGLGVDSLSATGLAKAGLNMVEGIVGPGLTNSLSFVADGATQFLGSMGVLSLFGVQSAVALVNPALMIYNVYNAGKIAVKLWNGAQNMRNSLYDQLYSYYRHRMPEDLWRQMDEPVRARLQEIFAQIIRESIDAIDRQDPPAATLSLYKEPTGIPQQSEEYKKGLALHDEKKYDEARSFYEAGAEKNDPWCLNALGEYYNEGWGGLQKDDEHAAELINKAADMNLPLANYYMGLLYLNGIGVPQDAQKGSEFLAKAAELDDPDANLKLGNCYATGRYVERDLQTARSYYEKAKKLGVEKADKGLYGLDHLPDFFITPEQFAWEYATDKKAADRKYEGHTVRMSGVISKIYPYSEQFHRLSFVFDVPGSGFVSCVFSKEDQIREVQSLKEGDWVTVQGAVGGVLGDWWVDYCWVVCTD